MLVQMFSAESIKVVRSADDRKTGDIVSTTLDTTQEELSDLEDMSNQYTTDETSWNSIQSKTFLDSEPRCLL